MEELAEGIADKIGIERELLLGKQVDSLTQRLRDVESTLEELSQIQQLADHPTSNGVTLQSDKDSTKVYYVWVITKNIVFFFIYMKRGKCI